MHKTRIIPCLLLKGLGLVKGVNFKNHRYIGDPMNAVRIFNEKNVDELLFLDILATDEHRIIDLKLLETIADECLMPFGVGGGIRKVEDARNILGAGAEKVCISTAAFETPSLISDIADKFGSQSIAASIDVKKTFFGKYEVYTHCGKINTGKNPIDFAIDLRKRGVGEIIVNSIDRDGTMKGYDIDLIKSISEQVDVPVIALGGASNYENLQDPIKLADCSASAAGSLFVFHGPRKAVLINYPS